MLHEMRLVGTTAADGSATIIGERVVFGLLVAVQWIDGDLADGVDAVLSTIRHEAATTLLTLTNANDDALYYPRHLVHSEAGTALTGTSGGDRAMPLICGVPQLGISSGGNAKTGGCIIVYQE
jgi:hypothetical protein